MKTSFFTILFISLITSISHGWETIVDYEENKPVSSRNLNSSPATISYKNNLLTSNNTREPENKDLLNCLCGCALPGTNFSCSYDTKSKGHSPSCRNIENGPCLCVAYGCVRKPLPGDSECTQKCREKYSESEPVDCEEDHGMGLSTTYANKNTCRPIAAPHWLSKWLSDNKYTWENGKYSDETQDLKNFHFCFDPLFPLLGENIPSTRKDQELEKEFLYKMLLKEGYEPIIPESLLKPKTPPSKRMTSGVDGNTLKTKKGDVLLLGFNEFQSSKITSNNKSIFTAPHYIIMENDKYFFQILNSSGGYIDKVQHIKTLFNPRDLSRLNRSDIYKTNKGRPYKTYIILRQKPKP